MINARLEVRTLTSKSGNPYNVYCYSFYSTVNHLGLTINDYKQVILVNEEVYDVQLINDNNGHYLIEPIGFHVPWNYVGALNRLFRCDKKDFEEIKESEVF